MKFISRFRETTLSIVDIEECYVIKNKANFRSVFIGWIP